MTTERAPVLLTPGPLTTSDATKRVMLRDWGSRDEAFTAITARVRRRLVEIVGGVGTHVAVPLQGSGTFTVEATLATLVPRDGKVAVLVNGAYGRRIAEILTVVGRAHVTLETPEEQSNDPAALDALLADDPSITHVAAVYCETTTGLRNPIEALGEVVARHGRSFLIDAMSAFGVLPLDARDVAFDAVMASSNKCLEGVPGVGFAVIREEALAACQGNAHSLTLDMYTQWRGFERNGQWRYTPPTQVMASFDQALTEYAEEGGRQARLDRYATNHATLVDGLRAMGFETLLPDHVRTPIIVTFLQPGDPNFEFVTFYDALRTKGFVIYPGKLTVADSFRVGCIGQVFPAQMEAFVAAVGEVLVEQRVTRTSPQEPTP